MDSKIALTAGVVLVVGLLIGAGAGFLAFNNNQSSDETYYYYLYFGADDSKNGWYSGTGSDAAVAFDNAMKKAGLEYEVSSYGYISTINGKSMSYCAQYVYEKTDATAASGSIKYPVNNDRSNGWVNMAGYDEDGVANKISQIDSTIFYISYYGGAPTYDVVYPWTETAYAAWHASGPFAA